MIWLETFLILHQTIITQLQNNGTNTRPERKFSDRLLDGNNPSLDFLINSLNEIANDNDNGKLLPRVLNYENQRERMKCIRMCLKVLFYKDIIETVSYKRKHREFYNKVKDLHVIQEMVIMPIIWKIAQSVLYINIQTPQSEIIEELKDWNSFLLLVEDWNKTIFPQSRMVPYLNNLTNNFKLFLENQSHQ